MKVLLESHVQKIQQKEKEEEQQEAAAEGGAESMLMQSLSLHSSSTASRVVPSEALGSGVNSDGRHCYTPFAPLEIL